MIDRRVVVENVKWRLAGAVFVAGGLLERAAPAQSFATAAPRRPLTAADPPPPPEREPRPAAGSSRDDDEVFSLTVSPLHLILPVLQLTAEFQPTPHFGVSLVGGYGKVSVDVENGYSKDSLHFSAYELGGRLIAYPLKKFKGLQLGAQALYVRVATEGANSVSHVDVSGSGEGLAVGPFVGYKLITSAGFTFFAQGGFHYLAIRADAEDEEGNRASDEDNRVGLLANLDVGWSF